MNHIESLVPGGIFYLSSQRIFSVGEMTHASSQMQEPQEASQWVQQQAKGPDWARRICSEYVLSLCHLSHIFSPLHHTPIGE